MQQSFLQTILISFCILLYAYRSLAQEVPETIDIANMRLRLQPLAKQEISNLMRDIKGNATEFKAKLAQADLYFPVIHDLMQEAGIPTELKYLALIDNDLSDSIAFWSINEDFAANLGLRVNRLMDERNNISAVTQAVARKLKNNHNLLNNWVFTLLSYRLSVQEVKNHILQNFTQINPNQLLNLNNLDISTYTHSDILKFIACVLVYKNQIGRNPDKSMELVRYGEVNNKTFALIAEEFGLTEARVQQYNPWLKMEVIPNDKKYEVLLPISADSPTAETSKSDTRGGLLLYETEETTLREIGVDDAKAKYHIVGRGQSLYSIARQYGVGFQSLLTVNKLSATSLIVPGQKLWIPNQANTPQNLPKTNFTPQNTAQTSVFHTVVKGETLYRISRQYNVGVADIQTWNSLTSASLNVGQNLKILQKKNDNTVIISETTQETPPKPNPKGTTGTRTLKAKTVPLQVEIGGIILKINPQARALIQKDVDLLLKSPQHFWGRLRLVDIYMPLVEQALQGEKVPLDFRYLPIQESALVANAVSTSNAVGYWQFKAASAIELGVRVNDAVDERMNIIAATIGACKYLKKSNLYFQNWVLSLLSYNLGFTGAKNHLALTYPGKNFKNVREMNIDGSTHWYIRKFLAHKIAFDPEIGVESPTKNLTEYTEGSRKTLLQIAQEQRTTLTAMRPHNLWLKTTVIPNDKPYSVIVPKAP
jgi:LysM repeat protein